MGGAAVATFFILSGFLNGYFYKRDNDTDKWVVACFKQYWKKMIHFYPLYVILLLCAVVLRRGTFVEFVENILLIQSWCGREAACSFNGVCWFLSSIMFCFFVSPALNRICEKIKEKELLVIVCLCVVEFALAFLWRCDLSPEGMGYYIMYMYPPVRCINFFEGILLSKIAERMKMDVSAQAANVLECGIILFYVFLCVVGEVLPYSLKATCIWSIPSMLCIIIFSRVRGDITKWCTNNGVLQFLGSYSFELFIVHRMVMWFFMRFTTSSIVVPVVFMTTILIVVGWDSLWQIGKMYGHTAKHVGF